MSGTVEGGRKSMQTRVAKYGLDSLRQMQSRGGKKSSNSEYARTPEGQQHLREAGRKGGRISRRHHDTDL